MTCCCCLPSSLSGYRRRLPLPCSLEAWRGFSGNAETFVAEPGALFCSFLALQTETLLCALKFLLCQCRAGGEEGQFFRCCRAWHVPGVCRCAAEHHVESEHVPCLGHERDEEMLPGLHTLLIPHAWSATVLDRFGVSWVVSHVMGDVTVPS